MRFLVTAEQMLADPSFGRRPGRRSGANRRYQSWRGRGQREAHAGRADQEISGAADVLGMEPIDVVARFGEDPDIDEVDAYVRSVMQTVLDRLGRERRFPVLG